MAVPQGVCCCHVKAMDVSELLMCHAVHEDLGHSSGWAIVYWTRRRERLFVYLKHHESTIQMFSNKEIFPGGQVYNHCNHRFTTAPKDGVKIFQLSTDPAQVMVLCVLGSDSKKVPPYFFLPSVYY